MHIRQRPFSNCDIFVKIRGNFKGNKILFNDILKCLNIVGGHTRQVQVKQYAFDFQFKYSIIQFEIIQGQVQEYLYLLECHVR